MSLIAELKRRNVFRVGVAYVISAWVMAQAADLVLDNIEAPDWVMQAILLVLAIGLPLALILAWAFELTPEGIKREKDVEAAASITRVTGRKLDFAIIALLAISLAYAVIDGYVLEAEPEQAPAVGEPTSIAEPIVREKSIAVLPFVNMSSDPEQEYFSDGLSEEILNLLAKVPDLKVIARTSSFAFKGENQDVRNIGQALDVSTVLEGSVRTSGDRLRITAQLIDVSSGAHIWSETYDRTLTDIFAVQDSVSSEILDALQIHVAKAPTRGRPTENTAAYALFLKAKAALNRYDAPTAQKFLLEAIELDPEFAEAHEQLAFSFWYTLASEMELGQTQEQMRDAAAVALAIDPNRLFARALFQAGDLEEYSPLRDLEAFERVVDQEPNHEGAADALFWDLQTYGYLVEALRIAEHFIDLDPLSPTAHFRLYGALRGTGRRTEALASLEIAEQLGLDLAKWELGIANLVEGRDEIGITYLEAYLQDQGEPMNWVRELVVGARDPATGQAHLDQLLPQIGADLGPAELLGGHHRFYLAFGFLDRYFEVIDEMGIHDTAWTDAEIPIHEGTIDRKSGFTAHPKYLEAAEAFGLFGVWEQRGPPDYCEKTGVQWVCE